MQQKRGDVAQGDDTRLLADCLAGNEYAWTELVHRYERLVYSIALKSGLNNEDAADVVQNVFTIVLRRLESLQQSDRFSAWLITVTHRESWRVKRTQPGMDHADSDLSIDPDPTADVQIVAWEQAALTHQALHQLNDRCRQLLGMLFLHEPRPTYESISTQLGIAVGSIGPIRARCLKQLRAGLAELGIEDAGQ